RPTSRTQREMKRVSPLKKPCSRPSSARTSPSLSPTTKVLPSRTLWVRSDKCDGLRDARAHHRAVGPLVGGGDHVNVAVLGNPRPKGPRGDPGQMTHPRP